MQKVMKWNGVTVINNLKSRTWAEIDLPNIEHNYRELRKRVPFDAEICCVVKADAYGHGAVRVARHLEASGAKFFAVSNIDEALQLRYADIASPILILGYTPPERISELYRYNISQCVYSYNYAKELSRRAENEKIKISVHLKIDAGMGRLGFICRHNIIESLHELLEVCSYTCFSLDGIFTHFPIADGGEKSKEATRAQFERFSKLIEILESKGISFKIRHCANSATAIDYPEYSLDMVRVGIALYGIPPSNELSTSIDLKNTFTLKTVVSNIKHTRKGDSIGYGADYVAQKDTTIATLPIGYADGFRRINYTSGTKLSVNGKLCNIVGRVCMDQVMIDVGQIKDLKIGDEVIVFGEGKEVNLADFAKRNETIPYEILCGVGARVPRLYRTVKDEPFV